MEKLTDEARRERNRYIREWRKNNPEKVKAAQTRYWEKKAARMKKEGAA